jgi:hypothetical protein
MIAAGSAEDVRRGDFQLVLGEFNAGINRLALPLFCDLHPNQQGIESCLEKDLRRHQVVLTANRYSKGHRVVFDTTSPRDLQILSFDTPSWRSRDRQIPISELVVEKSPASLIVRRRDGRGHFNIADIFAIILGAGYWRRISLLPAMAHRPRVAFDDLVVARESWSFACGDLAFASLPDTQSRFIGARRLLQATGLPRWVFARVPFERKPYYVDFESPLSVDALAKVIRLGAAEDPATSLTLGEMLPTPEQCWLTDAEGNRYTSELRLAVVKDETWQPRA